jgi:hypothetical protein
VLLSATRSDVCHIAFVLVGCTMVIVCAAAGLLRTRLKWAGAVLVAGLAVAPAGGAIVYGHALMKRPVPGTPIDEANRKELGISVLEARLSPGDRVVVAPYGGLQYLYTRHDNATSFCLLCDSDYCRAHWPIAARQILERLPPFMVMTSSIFARLAAQEPALSSRYFGYDGNYLLDRAEPGPALPPTWKWTLSRFDAAGRSAGSRSASFSVDGHLPRVLADLGGGPRRAAVYGRRFFLFEGDMTYVGTLEPGGAGVAGEVFDRGLPAGRFSAR